MKKGFLSIGVLTFIMVVLFVVAAATAVDNQRELTNSPAMSVINSGVYVGKSVDGVERYINIYSEECSCALVFNEPYDSFLIAGEYSIEGNKLKTPCYSFYILEDGSLQIIASEANENNAPISCRFEDGTVFRLDATRSLGRLLHG